MPWKAPYIIIRVSEDGNVVQVHQTEKIKDARYWLTYIALPGDAIFQTPAHPKHDGTEKIIYKAHLVSRGNISYQEASWLKMVKKESCPLEVTGL